MSLDKGRWHRAEYEENAQMGKYQTRLTLFEEAPIHTKKIFFFCKFVISRSINEQSSVTPTGYTGISRNISFDLGGLFERLFLKSP